MSDRNDKKTKKPIIWAEITRTEIADAAQDGAVVLIPTGSIEQHAEHLPVETDSVLAQSVAHAAARLMSGPVLVAPTVNFGFTPHHLSFCRTISLRLETYLAMLTDIAKSVIDAGFPRAIFINGHGGNSAPVRALCGQLITDGYPVSMVDYFAPGAERAFAQLKGLFKGLGHACEAETALMIALLARSGRSDLIAETCKGLPPRLIQPWIAPGHAQDPITDAGAAWAAIFQSDDCGYYGDPQAATKETGEALLNIMAEHLAEFLDNYAKTPLRIGIARDPQQPNIVR